MKQLNFEEIQYVSGGCEEHCWGDFEPGGLGAAMLGGAAAGVLAGPQGAIAGAIGGAVAYLLDVAWTD